MPSIPQGQSEQQSDWPYGDGSAPQSDAITLAGILVSIALILAILVTLGEESKKR